MNEHEMKSAEKPHVYRWSYEAQAAYDQQERKKRQGRGAKTYAIVMIVAFALCLGVLAATVLINEKETPSAALSVSEVSELVSPGTVLIYASGTDDAGFGTGFFISEDGYIVTNYHIVQNSARVTVTLYEGEELEAQTLWYSVSDDLALLKVEGRGFAPLTIGNSDAVQVGDTAIAVGNPAGNLCPWTTTQGIISAVDREVTVEEPRAIVDLTMLQTDAQVNPGNSGGPLCNDRGEVIGIVARKMTNYEGIGLAIPINGAMELVEAYLRTGSTDRVTSAISRVRPTIGIQAASLKAGDAVTEQFSAPADCVLVASVTAGGAADGVLKKGDLIMEANGKTVASMEDLKEILYTMKSGDTLALKVNRLGTVLSLSVKLGLVD